MRSTAASPSYGMWHDCSESSQCCACSISGSCTELIGVQRDLCEWHDSPAWAAAIPRARHQSARGATPNELLRHPVGSRRGWCNPCTGWANDQGVDSLGAWACDVRGKAPRCRARSAGRTPSRRDVHLRARVQDLPMGPRLRRGLAEILCPSTRRRRTRFVFVLHTYPRQLGPSLVPRRTWPGTWIGFTTLPTKENVDLVIGTPWHANFQAGEPNQGANENCGFFYQGHGDEWADLRPGDWIRLRARRRFVEWLHSRAWPRRSLGLLRVLQLLRRTH